MKILNAIIKPPEFIEHHNNVVNSKQNGDAKTALGLIAGQVSTRYDQYEENFSQRLLHKILQNDDMLANKDNLISCYKNKTKNTKKIFEFIRSAQEKGVLGACPYCGTALPKTHDHYLPEELYPEFSVHPLNLIPCCTECNTVKGARIVKNKKRIFIHFYADNIPNEQFLYVNIFTVPNSSAFGADFRIEKPAGFDDSDWELIESHYEELKLLSRFNDLSNTLITDCFTEARAHVKTGGTDIKSFINLICDPVEKLFGKNHWRVVLRRALAINQEFINKAILEGLIM